MTSTKAALGLATTTAIFAFVIAPAFANWQSNPVGNTTGTMFTGGVLLTSGGDSLSCSKAEGKWTIHDTTKQDIATKGGHLSLAITKWNSCTLHPVERLVGITSCEFELQQGPSKLNATATIPRGCEIETGPLGGTCFIFISSTSKTLTKVVLHNSKTNQIADANLTGVRTFSTMCFGMWEGSENSELKLSITSEGLAVV